MKSLGIDADEVEMVRDTLDWLMRDEISHLKGCEDRLALLIREAKALQVNDCDHEDFPEYDAKIQGAHQDLVAAADQCEQKFRETILFIGKPGHA
jgi:hypothetical protein